MKKWERAEINFVEITSTEHDWWPQPSLDGGYLGDGEVSGWFGEPDCPKPPTPTPQPTPDPDPAGDVDQLS